MMPLLEGTDGVQKMSKSLGNYIGISEPPKEMYGKLLSITDELMIKYYELLSHISMEELEALKRGIKDGTVHPKKAKEALALEIVGRYRGRDAALRAQEEFERIFKEKQLPDDIPGIAVTWNNEDIWLPQLLKEGGLCKSTGEAMRLIKQGGVWVNDRRVVDPQERFPEGEYIIKVGKRRFLKVKPG